MNWEELSPKDKAAYIKIGIKNGITSIADIQKAYNSFASGGYKGDSEDNSIRLSEVTVTPDKWQKDFHRNFATEATRKAMLEELKQEVARRQYAKDISGIHDRFMSGEISPEERKQLIGKALHRRATYDIDLYDAANRLYNVWNEAGRTKLTPEGSLINYINTDRANYNPITNTAYRINNIDDAVTELSHPIQSKHGDIGFWSKLGNIPQTIWEETIGDRRHYSNPNHYEYETHNIIQPELEGYIYEGIPTKYISNSFNDGGNLEPFSIPVNDKIETLYFRDPDTNKFYNAGKEVEDLNNDLLYAYYKTKVKPLLRAEDNSLAEYYEQQYRGTQKRRRAAARKQDIPKNSPTITITKGKSKGVKAPTALIDSLAKYAPSKEENKFYLGIAGLPSQETDFGKNLNFMQDRGRALSILNNERYDLPDQSFYKGLSHAIRTYYNKLNERNREGLTEEQYVKKYLNLDNVDKDSDIAKHIRESLKKDLTYKRFKSFIQEDFAPSPNLYKDTWKRLLNGTYNQGDDEYMSKVRKQRDLLKKDPALIKYVKDKGYL